MLHLRHRFSEALRLSTFAPSAQSDDDDTLLKESDYDRLVISRALRRWDDFPHAVGEVEFLIRNHYGARLAHAGSYACPASSV